MPLIPNAKEFMRSVASDSKTQQHETTGRLVGKSLNDELGWGQAGNFTEKNLAHFKYTLRIRFAFVSGA